MSDPSYALQVALVAALKAAGALPDVVGGRVYDSVPPDAAFPYVTLGDGQVLPDKAECVDGVEVSMQVDAWSRQVGYGEVKTIGAAIVAALDDKPLAVAGFNVTVFELESARYLRDPDGKTRHGVITFRGLLEAST